jgi:hypothetical protein
VLKIIADRAWAASAKTAARSSTGSDLIA